jgi:hypothetical protein
VRIGALLFLALLVSAANGQEAADLMPDDNEIPGWVKDGPPQTAETPEELYGLINGAAPIYIDNGFVEAVFQDYVGDIASQQSELNARVFDQGTSDGAQAVYDLTATGLETDWDGAGEEARINYALPFNFALDFWRNRFFVHLVINREADSLQALQSIQQFAIVMDGVAVPVELERFSARRIGDDIVLRWTTSCEVNSFGFDVLRSFRNDVLQALVVTETPIPSGGTIPCPREYEFRDQEVPTGVDLFYWLEEIALDGHRQLFGPVFVSREGSESSWGSIKAAFGS